MPEMDPRWGENAHGWFWSFSADPKPMPTLETGKAGQGDCPVAARDLHETGFSGDAK